jgi:hypothetical protein
MIIHIACYYSKGLQLLLLLGDDDGEWRLLLFYHSYSWHILTDDYPIIIIYIILS